jgi:hypothetical protein
MNDIYQGRALWPYRRLPQPHRHTIKDRIEAALRARNARIQLFSSQPPVILFSCALYARQQLRVF